MYANREYIELTIQRFASVAFWIAFMFWVVTVFLYYSEGRLPNNSFPGTPRFGGIIDYPNRLRRAYLRFWRL